MYAHSVSNAIFYECILYVCISYIISSNLKLRSIHLLILRTFRLRHLNITFGRIRRKGRTCYGDNEPSHGRIPRFLGNIIAQHFKNLYNFFNPKTTLISRHHWLPRLQFNYKIRLPLHLQIFNHSQIILHFGHLPRRHGHSADIFVIDCPCHGGKFWALVSNHVETSIAPNFPGVDPNAWTYVRERNGNWASCRDGKRRKFIHLGGMFLRKEGLGGFVVLKGNRNFALLREIWTVFYSVEKADFPGVIDQRFVRDCFRDFLQLEIL